VIWTSLLAVLLLDETLAVYQLIGIGMMLAGLVLVQVRTGPLKTLFKRRRKRAGQESAMSGPGADEPAPVAQAPVEPVAETQVPDAGVPDA
jgi:hypothetical protein